MERYALNAYLQIEEELLKDDETALEFSKLHAEGLEMDYSKLYHSTFDFNISAGVVGRCKAAGFKFHCQF